MKKTNNLLAYRIYPEPDGTKYNTNHLKNENTVLELFDYCQILEAIITKTGWDFLIQYHGYEKLFELNLKSGWFDIETIEELKTEIEN